VATDESMTKPTPNGSDIRNVETSSQQIETYPLAFRSALRLRDPGNAS
jgi:hypothetical protein